MTLARMGFGAATAPTRTIRRAGAALGGVGDVVWQTLNPAPRTPLNVPIGPYRRFAASSHRLDDFKRIKNALGGTVNDVLLAVVAGALRRFLTARAIPTEGLELRALVPVSVRPREHGGRLGELGNRLAAMRAPLPVHVADPVARLRAVTASMDGLKLSRQALGAEVLASVQNFAPPTLLAQASRLNFTTRLFNLLVTNVPGPRVPLFVLGREMTEAYPVAFLPRDHALAVAILSYNGQVNFGLLGDDDALPELEEISSWVGEEVAELPGLAGGPLDPPAPRPAGARSAHTKPGGGAPLTSTGVAASCGSLPVLAQQRVGDHVAALVVVTLKGPQRPLAREPEALERALRAGIADIGPGPQPLHAQGPEDEVGDERLARGVRSRSPVRRSQPGADHGAAVAERGLEHGGDADQPIVAVDDRELEREPAREPLRQRREPRCSLVLLPVGPPGEEARDLRVAGELEQAPGVVGAREAQADDGTAKREIAGRRLAHRRRLRSASGTPSRAESSRPRGPACRRSPHRPSPTDRSA